MEDACRMSKSILVRRVTAICRRPGSKRLKNMARKTRLKCYPTDISKSTTIMEAWSFPNPQEPHKGFKDLANVFFAHAPAIFGAGPENTSAIWFVDRFGNISEDTFDFIYRQSGWDTDAGFPTDEDLCARHLVH